MFRTLDATALNDIASDPEVRPFLGFNDPLAPIDLAHFVSNPDNFAFLTSHQDGGYLLIKLQPGLYAAHTLAKPSARGKPMMKLMREGFAAMFRGSDAVEIVTQIPDGNHNAEAWSELAGFRNTFRREAFFPMMGELVGCQFKSLSYGDWVTREANNRHMGEAFHAKLEQFHGHANHAPDAVHDAWVGATIGGCIEGNPVKAVGMFNRWAVVAGYNPATLVSQTPVVVDTGDAMLQLENGRVEILPTAQSASVH